MHQQNVAGAMARADLCRFIAGCYYEPSVEFAEENLFDSIIAAATQVDLQLAEQALRLRDHFAAESLQTLLVDYARLFLGPPKALAQPYASVWLTGDSTLMQEPTTGLLRLYEEAGLGIDESFRELPDHIAVELEFLYLLTYREAQARQANEQEKMAATRAIRQRFVEQHLARWIDAFADAVRSTARTEFYRELAGLTARLLAVLRVDASLGT
jgi:TorA maturation chaperone TorD